MSRPQTAGSALAAADQTARGCLGAVRLACAGGLFALLVRAAAPAAAGAEGLVFVEQSAAWQLSAPLRGIMAHAAACGDIDSDGDLDLFVGNFGDRPAERYSAAAGPVPNMLLINHRGSFRPADESVLALRARTSGAVFADLDNDGDLDLFVANNSKATGLRVPNQLYENVGGRFRNVSAGNGACVLMGGRSIGVLDFDGDGLLDLLVAGDRWCPGRTRLFRNAGALRFEDATAAARLPSDLPGLGVVACDFNADGWPDIFISQANRLFLAQRDGTYAEAGAEVFQYPAVNQEASPCGAAAADFDRDGDFDLVVVDHAQPARMRLYLNEHAQRGKAVFRDATRAAGLDYEFPSWTPEGLHLKHGHVDVADLDNDGWPDIVLAATWRAGGTSVPFVCRNRGVIGGQVCFDVPPVEKADAYYCAGPVADFDRDGRLDLFFANWFPQCPSPLFLNRSPRQHWLRVEVQGASINRMGVGARVAVYRPGSLGRPEALLGCQEITTGYGYCTGREAAAHFGLASHDRCDLEVRLPFGKGTIRRTDVLAGQSLLVREQEQQAPKPPRAPAP